MLEILFSHNVPDSTYFTVPDAEPIVKNGKIIVLNGRGTSRRWGRPSVTSTVVYQDDTLVAIHTGFHHKYRGGQFWRYFKAAGDRVEQLAWKNLSDAERETILAAYEEKAPDWAKCPGKLRSECKSPKDAVRTGYKLVGMDGDAMVSLYDGETEYTLGKTKREKAQEDHQGGFYYYLDIEQARALCHAKLAVNFRRFALLKIEAWGKTIEYGDKRASTYLKPVEVVEIIELEG